MFSIYVADLIRVWDCLLLLYTEKQMTKRGDVLE